MNNIPGLAEGAIGAGLMAMIAAAAALEITLGGIAMWRSARRSQTAWFVCLLLINTAGILPLVYLLTSGKRPERLA